MEPFDEGIFSLRDAEAAPPQSDSSKLGVSSEMVLCECCSTIRCLVSFLDSGVVVVVVVPLRYFVSKGKELFITINHNFIVVMRS